MLFETFSLLMLLSILFFIREKTSSFHGLFLSGSVSLFFLCKGIPVLILIPVMFSIVGHIKLNTREKTKSSFRSMDAFSHIAKKPATIWLIFFLSSMSVFSSFYSLIDLYGIQIGVSLKHTNIVAIVRILGTVIGPLLTGLLSDQKGTLVASIFLTICGETSIWLLTMPASHLYLYYIGNLTFGITFASFFIIIPKLLLLFFNPNSFRKTFIFFSPVIIGSWVIGFLVFHLFSSNILIISCFLIAILIISMMAAFFIFMAWQKRFVLVIDKAS